MLGSGSEYVTQRLTALLLERLPPGVAQPFFSLLPKSMTARSPALQLVAGSAEDTSIGYPDFVKHAESAIGTLDLMPDEALCKNVANAFLWAIVQDIPADLKNRMIQALPVELSSRMNLYSAMADGSKVA